MTSFKRFGSKSVVKYAYIGISTDRQCHNLLWQLYKNKYRICPIRIEIIHGGPMNYFLNIQCHGLISVGYCSFPFFSSVGLYISSILSLK